MRFQKSYPKLVVTRSPFYPNKPSNILDTDASDLTPSDPTPLDHSDNNTSLQIGSKSGPKIKIPPDNEYNPGDNNIPKYIMCCCVFGTLLGILIKFG